MWHFVIGLTNFCLLQGVREKEGLNEREMIKENGTDEREREESSVRERWVEREKLEKLNKMWKVGIKYNYFGLCYKTILHLDGTVVQLQILLQFQDFARPNDELFLCLYTKIYQHMTYRRPNVNPLTTQIGMVKTILYI